MENDESRNQQSEEGDGGLEPRTAPAPQQKNPETTPTAELVADYEALLAEIKVRKTNHDDHLKSLDGMRFEAVTAYEAAIKGASVEAAKLLVVISKRLGMPLNGAQPEQRYPSGYNAEHPGGPKQIGKSRGKYKVSGATLCKVCGKLFKAGMGMHMAMHARRGETAPSTDRSHHAQTGKQYVQRLSDERIRTLLIALRTHQPISAAELGRRIGQPNISASTTGLKERGLAINNDAKWTLTPKGAALIS